MAEASHGLGLDVGGTASRWTLVDGEGVKIAGGGAAPFSGHVFSDAARKSARAALQSIATALPDGVRPAAVSAGITGLPEESAEVPFFVAAIADIFGVPAHRIEVGDDVKLACLARFRPGEGIIVYAGTGAGAIHVTADGRTERAGGYGALIDDGGSAYWIAISALRAVLRQEDANPGAGWETLVGRGLANAIGGAGWRQVRPFVYDGDRGRVARLALAVAHAAQHGDTVALSILDLAGQELASLGSALRHRVGPLPVALAGGATRLHPALAAAFGNTIEGGHFSHDDIDASLAAARMALLLGRT